MKGLVPVARKEVIVGGRCGQDAYFLIAYMREELSLAYPVSKCKGVNYLKSSK